MLGNEPLYRRVLAPVKHGQQIHVCPYAAGLARAAGGQLILVHVLEEGESETEARCLAMEAQRRVGELGVAWSWVERRGEPAATLRDLARELEADVIVLTRFPDSPNAQRIQEELLGLSGPYQTSCPVMVVPTRRPARATRPPPLVVL